MKLKMLILSLGLLLSIPGYAAANNPEPGDHEEKAPCDCQEDRHHHMMHKDWQAKMAEREQKLLSWVDQYTPAKKGEWTQVLNEKKTLRNQWMSPENAEIREKWKKDKLAKIEGLKKQFDEGKLTKEEFIKKAHGGKGMAHWKTYHDLKLAVEKKDRKRAEIMLNQLLEQYKQHNQRIKAMLEE